MNYMLAQLLLHYDGRNWERTQYNSLNYLVLFFVAGFHLALHCLYRLVMIALFAVHAAIAVMVFAWKLTDDSVQEGTDVSSLD